MPRQYCPTPHCCTAPKRGVCPCQVDEIFRRRSAERMKALNADPEFKAKASERMKALNADPEFKAKASERMKALHADPEFKAKTSERMKALNADPEFKAKMKARRGIIPVPEHLRSYAAKLRRNGIRGEEFRKALESAT